MVEINRRNKVDPVPAETGHYAPPAASGHIHLRPRKGWYPKYDIDSELDPIDVSLAIRADDNR